MSLSRAGLIAVQDMGFNWPSVNGFEYWTLNGKRLTELPMAVEVADYVEDEA